jgi:hypothetical protein
VKRYGNYGRKVSWIWKLNQWDDRIQYMRRHVYCDIIDE